MGADRAAYDVVIDHLNMPEKVEAHAGVAGGTGAALAPAVMSTLHIWIPWGRVAKDQTNRAHSARQALLDAQGNPDTTLQSQAIGDEMEAAIVAVCASVFAVEAIINALALLVIPPSDLQKWADRTRRSVSAQTRRERTLEAAITDRSMARSLAARWQPLAEDRGAAVHFRAESLPLEMHPSGLTRTAAEAGRYSSEKAQAAVELLVETLTAVRDHPTPAAAGWAVGQQWFIDDLGQ